MLGRNNGQDRRSGTGSMNRAPETPTDLGSRSNDDRTEHRISHRPSGGTPPPGHALRRLAHAVPPLPAVPPAHPARPDLAGRRPHPGTALGQRRPAGRQSGPGRSHGPGAQIEVVRDPRRHRLQGDRGRVPRRLPDRLRLPAPDHRRGGDPRRRDHPGTGAVPGGADRAHLRIAGRRAAGHRPLLQLDVRAAASGGIRSRPGRHRRHRRQRRPPVQEVRVDGPGYRHPLRVLPGELHRHRARVRRRDLRSGDRR